MARRKLELEPRKEVEAKETEHKISLAELQDAIQDFGLLNDDLKSLKNDVGKRNEFIKENMMELLKPDAEGVRKTESEEYIAVLSIRDTSTMNEERLITFLKKKGHAKGIVKKKEYVDEKALTDAIYKGIISEQEVTEMESCKDPGSSKVLNVKKKKGVK